MRRFLWLFLFAVPVFAEDSFSSSNQLARDIFRELIDINSTNSIGGTGKAAEAMAARLRAAGFGGDDLRVAGPRVERNNVIVRLRGSGARRPLLLISHLDVVEAKREDWTMDPFHFVEIDGYFYGRGTSDIKDADAILVANLIRLKTENFRPDRDVIVALTANEEGGDPEENGVNWLLKNHRDWIDAEYCINPDGGGGEMRKGQRLLNELQFGEKGYLSFHLEVHNKGGHSSLPSKDNAIYHLASGLERLSRYDFPVMLQEGTRTYLEGMADRERPEVAEAMKKVISTTPPDAQAVAVLSAMPEYNAALRTTCVATMLEGGHAENALPQLARATVNCRVLPWHPAAEVMRTLEDVVHDSAIQITPIQPLAGVASPPSPLTPEMMRVTKQVTNAIWPGVPVVPMISAGASDSIYLRRAGIPAYGVSGLFDDMDDVRAHGRDERLCVRCFYDGQEFLFRLVTALSSK